MILKSIEICELNTDISNESAVKNFKEPKHIFCMLTVCFYLCLLFWGLAFDEILLRHICLIHLHHLFPFNIMLQNFSQKE